MLMKLRLNEAVHLVNWIRFVVVAFTEFFFFFFSGKYHFQLETQSERIFYILFHLLKKNHPIKFGKIIPS